MKSKTDSMTNEDFDRILLDILSKITAANLTTTVPGIYEIVAEEFNNEVLEKYAEEKEEEANA